VQLDAPLGENRLHVDRQPHLYTLARLLDLHPRTAVVTDTHRARILVFDLGVRRRQAIVENGSSAAATWADGRRCGSSDASTSTASSTSAR
jgi:hypothetical protein